MINTTKLLTVLMFFFVTSCVSFDWSNMSSHDTLESYELFLQAHPNSKYTSEAEAKIWEKTQTKGSCIDWQKIMKFPYSSQYGISESSKWSCNKIEVVEEITQTKIPCIDKHEIINRYARTATNNALGKRTKSESQAFPERRCKKIEVFMQFLQTYPESKYADEAKIRIEELDWEYVRYINTTPLLRKFLKIYPNTNHTDEVMSRIENRSWKLASSLYIPRKKTGVFIFSKHQSTNMWSPPVKKSSFKRIIDLHKFLDNYPNSQYSVLAKEQIRIIQDEYALRIKKYWEKANLLNTSSDYAKFINAYSGVENYLYSKSTNLIQRAREKLKIMEAHKADVVLRILDSVTSIDYSILEFSETNGTGVTFTDMNYELYCTKNIKKYWYRGHSEISKSHWVIIKPNKVKKVSFSRYLRIYDDKDCKQIRNGWFSGLDDYGNNVTVYFEIQKNTD